MLRTLTPLEKAIADVLPTLEFSSQIEEVEELLSEETQEFLTNEKSSWDIFFQGFFSVKAEMFKGGCNTASEIRRFLETQFDGVSQIVKLRVLVEKAKIFSQHKDPVTLLDVYQKKASKDQKELPLKLSTSLIILETAAAPSKIAQTAASSLPSVGDKPDDLATSTMSLDRPEWLKHKIPKSKFHYAQNPVIFMRHFANTPLTIESSKKPTLEKVVEPLTPK